MSTYAVLSTPIPTGMGRKLTTHECKKLRRYGIACSPRYIVVQTYTGTTCLGRLYKPSRQGRTFDNIGVMVSQ